MTSSSWTKERAPRKFSDGIAFASRNVAPIVTASYGDSARKGHLALVARDLK
jgi:hypothetical protein